MAAHIDNIIKDLNKAKFIVLIDDSKKCMKGSLTLRANISSKEEADEFMHQLSTVTYTNWIVHYDVASPQRYIIYSYILQFVINMLFYVTEWCSTKLGYASIAHIINRNKLKLKEILSAEQQ